MVSWDCGLSTSHAHTVYRKLPPVSRRGAHASQICYKNVKSSQIIASTILCKVVTLAKMLRGAIVLACLLCLSSAFAQNLNSTAFANLTVIRQNDANFSSNVTLPSFPCDASSPGLVGGYKPLDLDDVDLYYVTQYVLDYFTRATANLTDCDIFRGGIFNITDACSQVRPVGTAFAAAACACQVCTLLLEVQLPEVLKFNCACRWLWAQTMPLRLSPPTAA